MNFKAFVKTRSSSLKPANSGPSKELEPSKTGPVRRDSGPGWQDRPVPISPHIGKHSKWRQTAPWLGSKEVGPPPWAQDKLCYRNTTCLLHFLLKQDTLHPPDQSAQHGSREEVQGTRRPHPGWPFPGGGCGHMPGTGAQLPPVLHWGDNHVLSDRKWVLIRTQVTVLTQRWPSPGSTGENFPAGKRNREWDPSEDRYQGSSAPGGPGVYCTSLLLHMYNVHAEYWERSPQSRTSTGIMLGPFTPDIPATRSRGR